MKGSGLHGICGSIETTITRPRKASERGVTGNPSCDQGQHCLYSIFIHPASPVDDVGDGTPLATIGMAHSRSLIVSVPLLFTLCFESP